MNLISTFLEQAARSPDRIAIVDGSGRSITFGVLASRSARVAAAWCTRGLQTGDRALMAMGLGIELYVALAALWRIGAVAVLPEPALGLKGLRHAARTTKPKAYLSSGWYRALGWVLPELRRLPLKLDPSQHAAGKDAYATVSGEHPALISFTSGTTGAPKAIARSHGLLAAQNRALFSLLKPQRESEIDLVAFPAFVIVNLGLGVTSVLPNWSVQRHDAAEPAAIAEHITRHAVTRALLPPSICETLVRGPSLPLLKAVFTGGGPVFPDLMERLAAHLPDAKVVAVYGSTEAEPIAHLNVDSLAREDWLAMREGAGLLAGTPVPEVSVRVVDDEILVMGDHVNKGYLNSRQNADNKVAIDGAIWHRTGDAGYLDKKGRLWLLGRVAARVSDHYPFPIEAAARCWPGVSNAALVGISGNAVLAIEGDNSEIPTWHRAADRLRYVTVVPVDDIPMDRRHRSKVDYPALRRKLDSHVPDAQRSATVARGET
jgi:acyl-CoA synthetase (AMP-forming)/AMP-acid ligase II